MGYELHNAVSNHIESFNLIYESGLNKILEYMEPMEIID